MALDEPYAAAFFMPFCRQDRSHNLHRFYKTWTKTACIMKSYKGTGNQDQMEAAMATAAIKSNDIFERVEVKYMMSASDYEALRTRIEPYMAVDSYGLSTICNIYFDTDDFRLIRESLEKPVYKEKLRLRSYGVPKDDSTVFLEIKKKFDGIVYKRRVELKCCEAMEYLRGGRKPDSIINTQIGREIDYFINLYHPVPKMFIGYDRIAMFGTQDSSIRMTFDFNIRSREEKLDLRSGDDGEHFTGEGQVLMEVKVGGAYPMWMVKAFDALEIYPVSFSKYGAIYSKEYAGRRIESYVNQTVPESGYVFSGFADGTRTSEI